MAASTSTFHRDADGNRIEKLTVLPSPPNSAMPPPPPAPAGTDSDVREFKTTYYFDPEKRALEATTYRQLGELLKTEVYLFDKQGRISERTNTDGPTIPFGSQSRRQDKRGTHGVLLESIYYGKDGTITSRTRFQSRLDKHGNWIRRTEISTDATGRANDTQFTSVRTITYY